MRDGDREDWRIRPRPGNAGGGRRAITNATWGRLEVTRGRRPDDLPRAGDAWPEEDLEELLIRARPGLADRVRERTGPTVTRSRERTLSESWMIRAAIVVFLAGPFIADAMMGRAWWLTAVGWGYVGFAASLLALLAYHAWTMRGPGHREARRRLFEYLDAHAHDHPRGRDEGKGGPRRA